MAKYFIRKCAAAITTAFLLSAMSTIDRHDEHLNAAVAAHYQNKAEVSQQYVDAAYNAMIERISNGNDGVIYD